MLPEATLETFPNGLKLVFTPNPHSEAVALGIFVSSGARHEPKKLLGISHFIEHMLFKGTTTRTAAEISRIIEGKGGHFNAFTSEEVTCFYTYLPCEGLKSAIDILTDMYSNAAISEKEFEREKAVVLEEIKMYEDEPDAVASENLSKLLYPKNNLGLPIAGSAKTLIPMTPDDLRSYIAKAYVPQSTVVVVSGNFNIDQVRAHIASTLGRKEPGKKLSYNKVKLSDKVIPEMSVKRDVQQLQLAMGFKIFGERASTAEKSAAKIFDCMMGHGMSSRLFQSVREKKGLSYDIHSQIQFFGDVGGWSITAGLDSSRVPLAIKTIENELDRIRDKKPSSAELRRTKDFLLGHFRLGMEQVRTQLFYYGGSVLTHGKIIRPCELIESLESITSEDIQNIAQKILVDSRKGVSFVTPMNWK